MKIFKLILVAIAMFLTINQVLCTNQAKGLPVNLAKNMVNKLCKYVELTDSQKYVIQISAEMYQTKMRNTISDKTILNKQILLNEELSKYRNCVNEVLTAEQKDTLLMRQNREFTNEIIKK